MPAGLLGPAFPQRSPPWLLTTAACGGLRSTPDCRSRRALLHLSYSCIPPCGPAIFVTQDPERTLRLARLKLLDRRRMALFAWPLFSIGLLIHTSLRLIVSLP